MNKENTPGKDSSRFIVTCKIDWSGLTVKNHLGAMWKFYREQPIKNMTI